jgi:ketosteroid isomerase-like protein
MRTAALLLLSCLAFTATAQTTPTPDEHSGHHPAPAADSSTEIPADADAEAAVAVVDAFGKALAAGDFKTVEALLDPEVLILESGGAERDRAEYLGHHAIADAQFLMNAHVQTGRRRARASGDVAWVGTESELHASEDGKPMTLLSTETMVLRKSDAGWRIVHIHWSSRQKKS